MGSSWLTPRRFSHPGQEVGAVCRTVAILVVVCVALLGAIPAGACSLAGCLDRGVEMRSDFDTMIRHGDEPLPGTAVEITGPRGTSDAKKFTVKTDRNGIAHITNLAPGDYWLEATYLGIGAAYECFHVNRRPSGKAKHNLAYDWGDTTLETRRIAGKLLDLRMGTGGTVVWNLTHPVEVPIVAAKLTLQNAITRLVYHTMSDANGGFAFDDLPNGTYVLHIDAGKVDSDHDYEASDHLVDLRSTAKRTSLVLRRREASGGSCGGTSLELQDSGDNS